MPKRPNILYLLNDHQAYYGHGTYGGPAIRRPHFDRLATGGVEFSRAYCASPLCGPSRRTMLTGLFPHNHGEIRNDCNHPFDREVYLDQLAEAGYRNYYFGKWHAGGGTAHDHCCEGFCYPSYNNPYTKPEYHQYLKEKGLPEFEVRIVHSFWNSPEDARKAREEDPDSAEGAEPGERFHVRSAWCAAHATGVMTTPKETHEAFFLAHLAREQLRKLAEDESEQPWSLRVDFWGPHQPYFPAQEFLDLYDPEAIPEYPSFRDDLSTKPELYRIEINWPLSENHRLIHPNPLPWSVWQRVLALDYAHITMVDAAGGLILDALEELGLAGNTLVVWSADHGDAIACHGGHFDKNGYMPEEMLRIPMAVRLPGVIPAGHKRSELVGNIDLAPTFLDAAGTHFSRSVDGTSLLPLCRGEDNGWREDLMCETHGHLVLQAGRTLVTDRYKYTWNEDDMDELYDLESDPYEMTNRIFDPDDADILAEMKSRLARWQSETYDGTRAAPQE